MPACHLDTNGDVQAIFQECMQKGLWGIALSAQTPVDAAEEAYPARSGSLADRDWTCSMPPPATRSYGLLYLLLVQRLLLVYGHAVSVQVMGSEVFLLQLDSYPNEPGTQRQHSQGDGSRQRQPPVGRDNKCTIPYSIADKRCGEEVLSQSEGFKRRSCSLTKTVVVGK
jgi:hypothetical protein